MPIANSGGNQFNPSALVSKTVMGLLQAKPTLAKFANSTHNRIFSDKVKAYAPGTSYTMNIPTYPQVQFGSSVTPSAKQIRTETINIDTSNDPTTSGYINAVRVVDQVSEQLYIQDPDEWNRQFVKPTFDAMYGNINIFLERQLRNSAAYTVLPRFLNDRGGTNEAGGRWTVADITMFNRAMDYMAAMNMMNYEDFIFCMSTSTFTEILNAITGMWSNLPSAGTISNRYTNRTNEEILEKGGLSKIYGFYVYHTPYIPYHYSGTMKYALASGTGGGLPTAGANADFTGATYAASTTVTMYKCFGFNTTVGSTAPTPSGFTLANSTTIVPIPETKGYLIIGIDTGGVVPTNQIIFSFEPGDIIELNYFGSPTPTASVGGIPIIAVDPITKKARAERFTCNVACKAPFQIQGNLSAGTGNKLYFYLPVNFLPYGYDALAAASTGTINVPNELQTVGLQGAVTTSIYNAADANNNVFFKSVPYSSTVSKDSVTFRHFGNHTKIYGFSRNGLHFVNPPLSDIVGAENNQVYDEKARMSLLTTIQGGVAAGTNIMRTSSLWGSGGITDAIVQIPYYPNYS